VARVLCTLDEPLARAGGHMAGLQVRVYEMAGALARAGHDVTVAAPPGEVPAAAAFRVAPLAGVGRLGAADVWITHPRMVAAHAGSVRATALVVDGYESPFGSFLAHAAALLPRIGERAAYDYRATMVAFLAAFARADRVLCANEAQHVSYLTILSMLGRIGPRTPDADLVLTVSSGAAPAPPARGRDAAVHAPTVLWCGGCYPWFDVETYLAALPQIAARVPDVRFLFAGIDGIERPAAEGGLPLARRIRETIARAPDLRARTRFVDWRPYGERGALYAEADVGVCTYGDHLETRLAMRTRVIDMIWGGLPLVVSAGDEMSRVVRAHELGRVVEPGDPAALAAAVVSLLADPECRRRATARARALVAGELGWDRQVVPLARYCDGVAAGRAVRHGGVAPTEALVRLNDGWVRHATDRTRRLAWRLASAWRRARTEGVRACLERVWA
jgi:glycosyltransferase involved in cell wall biosynthesis